MKMKNELIAEAMRKRGPQQHNDESDEGDDDCGAEGDLGDDELTSEDCE